MGGLFLGKFIKIENGTGIYRNDYSLMIKINGSWTDEPGTLAEYDSDVWYESTVRDETS